MNRRPSSGRGSPAARPASVRNGQQRAPNAKALAQNGRDGGSKLDKWDLHSVIAKGSFGTVYRAVNKETGVVYALKEVNLKGMKMVERQESIDEARILSGLDCQYITQHFESFIEDEKLHIVMELAEKGSLHALLKGRNGKGLPEDKVWQYFIQALLALNYLHTKKIVHRDIKTLNLFLTESGDIMVGDLGIARALSDNTDFCRTIMGTPYYLSPELCEDKPYNEKSDVWALGVVLYEMCMTVHPFTALNEGALVKKILRGAFAPVVGYSPQIVDMVKQCLTYDYKRRPDTHALLRNPVLRSKAAALKISLTPSPRLRTPPQPKAPNPVGRQQQQQQQWDSPASGSPQRPPSAGHYSPQYGHPSPKYHREQQQQRPAAHQPPYQGGGGGGGGWPEPAQDDLDWPARAAAPGQAPKEMAAQQRRGAGGPLPGGMDPYERTPPGQQQYQEHHYQQQQQRTAGARHVRRAGESPLPHGDPHDDGALAYEMQKRLELEQREAALRQAAAANAQQRLEYQRGQHPGQHDNLHSLMKGAYAPQDDTSDWPRPGAQVGQAADLGRQAGAATWTAVKDRGPLHTTARTRAGPGAKTTVMQGYGKCPLQLMGGGALQTCRSQALL
eukprot:CAMPEP_0117669368 /NCGR_PEP_ID=MMETSP0804-20121206/12091_1 /TAXON_ID=1074897 /ORGANISM="Tetraselmis astigmatica, Strain CCMP880" /LENGTH=615 /DNA_ID=CAMNT_0005477413 /DNA_START=101 /DNA_END=1949 /DNA_ORIENTATION=+